MVIILEKIEIDGKKYSKRTLELLSGVKGFYAVDTELLAVAEAIDYPYEFPFLVEDIYDMDFDEDLRLALIRVQLDSKLHMRDDLEGEQLRIYVAESIEKMLFGELLMEGNGAGKPKRRGKRKSKKTDTKSKTASKSKTETKSQGRGGGRGKGGGKGGGRGGGKGRGKGKGKKSRDTRGGEPMSGIFV